MPGAKSGFQEQGEGGVAPPSPAPRKLCPAFRSHPPPPAAFAPGRFAPSPAGPSLPFRPTPRPDRGHVPFFLICLGPGRGIFRRDTSYRNPHPVASPSPPLWPPDSLSVAVRSHQTAARPPLWSPDSALPSAPGFHAEPPITSPIIVLRWLLAANGAVHGVI